MVFIALTFLNLMYVIFLGLRKKYFMNETKAFLYNISIKTLFTSVVIGLLEGTSYSHGFDIPWWGFSLSSFVIILSFTCLFIGILKIKNKLYSMFK